MRILLPVLFALAATNPLAAQQHQHDPDDAVADGGTLPAGWHARLDRADASMDNVKFMAMENGYHATLGPAAIFYNPADVAEGTYRAQATFTQMQAPRHPESYGLLIGGKDLEGDNQSYLYFLIRQDGKFLIKHRAGADTHTVQDWTEHSAIHPSDADGKATNLLAIEADPERTRFLVNGTEVAAFEATPDMNTEGIAGLRINHNLDVQVTDFEIDRTSM